MRTPAAVRVPFAFAFAGALAAQQFAADVDALCRPLIDGEFAVGCTVGVIDGDAALVRGYGLVSPDGDRVPDGATVYEIGSISKVFTGLLLADAVERGLVSVDDEVQRLLPDGTRVPAADGRPIRLRDLTTHSSGLPRLLPGPSPDPADPYAHLTPERLLAGLATVSLRGKPGERYEYSNLGAGLLGHALVLRNGAASYGDLLAERIARPLALDDTVVALDDAARARLAPPFDGDLQPSHNWDLAALAGAGGIRSTADDLLKFARAQLHPAGGTLASAIASSHQPLFTDGKDTTVAYGWHVADGGATLWHNGQTGGYHGFLAVQPGRGRAVCILANGARGESDQVGRAILQRLGGGPLLPLQVEKAVAVDRALLQRCVGDYRNDGGARFAVKLAARGLVARLDDQPVLRLHARSPTEYYYRAVEASLTFEVAGDRAVALELHQGGHDQRFVRIDDGAVKAR